MDLGGLTGAECVAHAVAVQRVHNRSCAARLAAVLEVGLCAPDSADRVERMDAPDRYSADEVRAMYALSLPASTKLLDLAWVVCRRLPELHAAMVAGELDEQRAWAIAHWTEQLSDEHAHLICEDVLPHCLLSSEEPWVTGKLVAQIKKLAIALDPDWAERIYADAIRRRRIVAWRNPDGSADLSGQQLEVDRVAAACGRIRALADAAKRGGDPRPIDAIRADLFLGMLDGTWAGLSDEQILADYARTRPAPEPQTHAVSEVASAPGEDGLREDIRAGVRASARQSPRVGVQLRVKLSTLLGWDQHPGELAGWGPVDAVHARRLARMLSHGTWRAAIVGDEGQVFATSLCTRRPEGWRPRKAWAKGIVDLLVPISVLTEILTSRYDPAIAAIPPEWPPVLDELVRTVARRGEILERRYDQLQAERLEAELTGDPAVVAAVRARPLRPADARRRFPREDLRRRLQLRIDSCIGYTCTRPSRQAEIDHVRDHAKGGLTLEENLAPECGHDHDLKTRGGWRLERIDEHRYCWISRLGQHYPVTLRPVIEDLPEPGPAPQRVVETHPDPALDSAGRAWQDSNPWSGDLAPPHDRQRSCPTTDEAA